MEEIKTPLSQEELGVYLASIEGGLLYNLPFSIFLGKKKPEDVKKVLKDTLIAHPSINTQFFTDGNGEAYKKEIKEDLKVPVKENINPSSWPKEFILTKHPLYRFEIENNKNGLTLFCDFHHTIMDGTSLRLFVDELENRLSSKKSNKETEDVAFKAGENEQKLRKNRVNYEKSKDYYLHAFGDIDCESLPVIDKKDEKKTNAILEIPLSLSLEKVRKFAHQNMIRTSSFFLGVYAKVIALFSGTEDAYFLTVNNGRNEDEKKALGMFTMSMPIYSKIPQNGDISAFLSLLNLEQEENLKNRLYSYTDFSKDATSLPASIFAYQGDDYRSYGKLKIASIEVKDGISSFAVNLYREKERFLINISYRNDLFASENMVHFAEVFDLVASEFLKKKKLEDINLISNNEKTLLNSFQETHLEKYKKTNVVDMFEEQAKKEPSHLALVYHDTKLTYLDVKTKSDSIAYYLVSKGYKKGQIAAILLPRDERTPYLALGIVKAGLAYQPLDATYPDERLSFMLSDSGAAILFTTESLLKRIKDFKGEVVLEDKLASLYAPKCSLPSIEPDDLFALLYTSGSTGLPKGVMLLHKGISIFTQVYSKNSSANNKSLISCYASFGFDAGMADIFNSLTSGATLYIIDEETRLNLRAMNEYLVKNKITHSFFTTQVGRQMSLDYFNPYLKELSLGGEKLVPFKPIHKFHITNAYGPTETTVYISSHEVTSLDYRVPIGKPFDTIKAYIVDASLHQLPFGLPGELLITGPQVGKGYLHRDIETAKHFIDNPFSKDPAFAKGYRTGDVVRYLANGELDIIGRKDSQVKIRGFRIELSEVEAVIREYKGIKDATVIALPDPNGGSKLAAYVVSDSKVDIKGLKDFITKKKPPYMVPPAIMQIERIPLNQNSKVNKKALPVIEASKEDIVLPRNDKEKKVYKAALEVLGDTGFGVTDDLFAYGLSSIGLMKFLTLIEERLGIDVSAKDIKEAKTIEKIVSLKGEEKASYVLASDYPLTKNQEGIYVESIANPSSTIYNIDFLLKVDAHLDLDKLEEALKKAVEVHSYIKGRLFIGKDGAPRIKPSNEEAIISRVNVDKLDKNSLVKPFDLLKDRLYRISIISSPKERYLFLEVHHLVFDGASLVVFLKDVEKLYLGQKVNKEAKDGFQIALDEEKKRTPEELTKEKAYYESFLKGVEGSSTPRKEPESQKEKENGIIDLPLKINRAKLSSFLKEHHLTSKGFYNAVFSFALAKWNDSEESLFTTIYEGRDLASYVSSVTMLVKTLPVYAQIKEKETVADYLSQIETQLSESESNTLYSFAELSHDFSLPSDTLFAYQGDGFAINSFATLPAEDITILSSTPKSSFMSEIIENETGITAHFEYDKSLYLEEMPVHFAEMMESVANEFLSKENLDEVESCSKTSKEEIDKYNATDDKFIASNYEELFQASVKKNPTKKAVIAIDETLTYPELDRRSSIIANFLLKKGLKKDDKIVVMMPRVANAYSVIQGVLKAGGCFAPVDPKYPDDRISYIIENSGTPFVVTTKKIKDEREKTLGTVPFYALEDIFKDSPNEAFPNVKIEPDALAYCIYTSGSTGKPKGVMIEEHSLVNYISNTPHNLVAQEYLKYAHVTVALASLSFDISVDEEMVPLANGLTVMLASEDEILNPILLAKRMKENHVDFAFPVPSYLNNALDAKEAVDAFKNLNCIKAGGEPFSQSLYNKVRSLGINAVLHNVYGPTEITVANCQDTITDGNRITIGYPSANYRDYIIDRNNHLVPFGASGEILVAGEGVSRGYVGRDDLNSTKYLTINGKRAFKTGDVGRFLYDGRVDIFGRRDNQVKLRGLRVELDEISTQMELFKGITKAVALVKESPADGQFLVGYFTSSEDINLEELKKHLAKSLTPYMIPHVYMHLDTFPLTNNGKVDKKSLPTPEAKATSSKSKRLPKNDLQKKLYDIYEKVLGTKDFSIDDDFFELGGSSLSASKVAMLAMEEGLPLSYGDVFANPSVADLYDHILLSKADAIKPLSEQKKEPIATKSSSKALKCNDIAHLDDMKIDHELGRVLLFGATGFLGIHVLKELINNPKQQVLCLVRPGKSVNAEMRLKGLLAYYFDSPLEEAFKKQIKVVEGDITSGSLNTILKDEHFDTIINCAAIVKHFSNDDSIETVNFHGVEGLIVLALHNNARLVQVSTLSVAGQNINHQFPDSFRMKENQIFFGQDISNKYVHSKIMAEQAIQKSIDEGKLRGKIVRVGNLMPRESDGEFQINAITNNFMNSLKAYATLGEFPLSMADSTVDFSPIDEVAKTIILFAKTPDEFTIFHSANSHEVQMGDVIEAMNGTGFKIKLVDDASFNCHLHDEMSKGNEAVAPLIRYDVSGASSSFILSDNSFSVKALYHLGYKWPLTDEKYLNIAIDALKTIGFFSE
jgi:amino acid adenylation domain-containing protein